jgi:hypothetical protein
MSHPITDAIIGMTPAERAAYKSAQISAKPAPDSLVAGDRMVAINDITTVGGILEFNVAVWFDVGGGSWQLADTSAINPVRVVNPPILVPDPGGDIERAHEDPHTHVVTSTFYREDTDSALLQIAYDVAAHLVNPGNEM